ncbi:MAG: SAM-dependent methyltransferase [Puniceicoccales bacterium]
MTPGAGFRLESVVPWGRSLAEYRSMFALTDADLGRSILGCGDGPASFNAELTARGGSVVSVDPVYQFSREEIAARVEAVRPVVMENVRANRQTFVWKEIADPESLERIRMTAMNRFLEDFEEGREAGRYRVGGLPDLPCRVGEFDLALVSHFLFLYSDHLDEAFHREGILSLLQVAREVRVFPVVELSGQRSRHLDSVRSRLRDEGVVDQLLPVRYEFQKGAAQMLVLSRG